MSTKALAARFNEAAENMLGAARKLGKEFEARRAIRDAASQYGLVFDRGELRWVPAEPPDAKEAPEA